MSTSSTHPRIDGQPHRAPSAVAAMCACDQQVEPGVAGDIVVVRLTGEIDLSTVAVVEDALTAALEHRPADLVVDLAGTVFCSLRGIALLATTADTADARGTRFAVSGLNPRLDRIATRLWPEHRYVRYRSAAAAVAAIRIDQTHRPT